MDVDSTGQPEQDRLDHHLLHDHRWALRAAVALWLVAGSLFIAMAIPPVRDALDTFDEGLYDLTFPFKWGPLTALAWTLNFIGSGFFAWPFRAAVTTVLVMRKRWEGVAAWLGAIVLSEPFIWILKTLYDRERPPEALVDTVSASFPSGHAIVGAVMAVGLVVVFVPAGPQRRNLEILGALSALIMGGSRVYLGAHWFTDVVAGVAFGAAVAMASAVVVHRTFVRRGLPTEPG